MTTELKVESEIKPVAGENTSALPLAGEKGYYKGLGVVALVILVMLSNYFLLHKSKKATETTEETYNTTNETPITKPAATTPTVVVQSDPEVDTKKQLQEKIAAAKAQDFIDRLQASQNAGSSLANNSVQPATNSQSAGTENDSLHAVNSYPQDPNTAFLLQASNSKAQREYATHFGPLQYVIGQGKFIFGTLAVAINSDLPGQIEAVVSQDVYGEQGNKVLIPRGSHLIGEYRSGLVNNQSRLFTVWTRVKEPNGVDIQLGSEGTDALGRAGLTGHVDYHFFDRFGSALLISMIGAGAANIGVNPSDQYNSASAYRSGIADAMSEQGKSMLEQNINIPPTINISQGEKIVVFVNRDLDFSRVYR
jgi:type IV secretion system protein VirB10